MTITKLNVCGADDLFISLGSGLKAVASFRATDMEDGSLALTVNHLMAALVTLRPSDCNDKNKILAKIDEALLNLDDYAGVMATRFPNLALEDIKIAAKGSLEGAKEHVDDIQREAKKWSQKKRWPWQDKISPVDDAELAKFANTINDSPLCPESLKILANHNRVNFVAANNLPEILPDRAKTSDLYFSEPYSGFAGAKIDIATNPIEPAGLAEFMMHTLYNLISNDKDVTDLLASKRGRDAVRELQSNPSFRGYSKSWDANTDRVLPALAMTHFLLNDSKSPIRAARLKAEFPKATELYNRFMDLANAKAKAIQQAKNKGVTEPQLPKNYIFTSEQTRAPEEMRQGEFAADFQRLYHAVNPSLERHKDFGDAVFVDAIIETAYASRRAEAITNGHLTDAQIALADLLDSWEKANPEKLIALRKAKVQIDDYLKINPKNFPDDHAKHRRLQTAIKESPTYIQSVLTAEIKAKAYKNVPRDYAVAADAANLALLQAEIEPIRIELNAWHDFDKRLGNSLFDKSVLERAAWVARVKERKLVPSLKEDSSHVIDGIRELFRRTEPEYCPDTAERARNRAIVGRLRDSTPLLVIAALGTDKQLRTLRDVYQGQSADRKQRLDELTDDVLRQVELISSSQQAADTPKDTGNGGTGNNPPPPGKPPLPSGFSPNGDDPDGRIPQSPPLTAYDIGQRIDTLIQNQGGGYNQWKLNLVSPKGNNGLALTLYDDADRHTHPMFINLHQNDSTRAERLYWQAVSHIIDNHPELKPYRDPTRPGYYAPGFEDPIPTGDFTAELTKGSGSFKVTLTWPATASREKIDWVLNIGLPRSNDRRDDAQYRVQIMRDIIEMLGEAHETRFPDESYMNANKGQLINLLKDHVGRGEWVYPRQEFITPDFPSSLKLNTHPESGQRARLHIAPMEQTGTVDNTWSQATQLFVNGKRIKGGAAQINTQVISDQVGRDRSQRALDQELLGLSRKEFALELDDPTKLRAVNEAELAMNPHLIGKYQMRDIQTRMRSYDMDVMVRERGERVQSDGKIYFSIEIVKGGRDGLEEPIPASERRGGASRTINNFSIDVEHKNDIPHFINKVKDLLGPKLERQYSPDTPKDQRADEAPKSRTRFGPVKAPRAFSEAIKEARSTYNHVKPSHIVMRDDGAQHGPAI